MINDKPDVTLLQRQRSGDRAPPSAFLGPCHGLGGRQGGVGVPAHTTGSSAVRQETPRSGEQTPGKPISSWQTTGAFLDISAPVPKIPNKAVVGIGKTLLPESDTVPAQLRGCHITLNPSSRNVSGTRTTPRRLSRGVRAPPCSPHSSNPGCSRTRNAAHFLCLVTVRNTWPERKIPGAGQAVVLGY